MMISEPKLISNFALTHFNAAKHFSNRTREIESENAGQPYGNYWEEVSVYCASSLMLAAASLEALINELYISPGPIHSTIPNFDAFFWGDDDKDKSGWERKSALCKYRKAVKLLGQPPLSKNDSEYLAADTLFGFRNYLIHFKPLWDTNRRNEQLETSLVDRFALSPYAGEGEPFIEMRCMSAGCSAWAVDTVIDFVCYFSRRSGLHDDKLKAFRW